MTKVIKRYKNRKMYDTQTCQYTTLTAIKDSVLAGVDVVVIDNDSKRDVTNKILRLVIAEHVPVDTAVLVSLIKESANVTANV